MCEYYENGTWGQRIGSGLAGLSRSVGNDYLRETSSFETAEGLPNEDQLLSNMDFTFPHTLEVIESQNFPKNQLQALDFDEFLHCEDDTTSQRQLPRDFLVATQEEHDRQTASWCKWMRGDFSIAAVTDNDPAKFQSIVYSGRPHAQHNADLIVQALRSFPTMMLRKETFPWFIHPRSYISPTDTTVPKALSSCMAISQVFISRTPETLQFLRQSIGAECRKFTSEVEIIPFPINSFPLTMWQMHDMSKFELLAAMQACMIYLVMYIINYSYEDEKILQELLRAILVGHLINP